MNPILILGGYGNFGKRISRALTDKNLPVVIAGRNPEKARAFASSLPPTLVKIAIFDAEKELDGQLKILRPSVVVNTCGPFQNKNYGLARICIDNRVHYIDLADGRDFVVGASALDAAAKAAGVAVISGASTVPGLSSAVIDFYSPEFSHIDRVDFGVAPGQSAERGLATTQGILTYVGAKLKTFAGAPIPIYGWQNIYRQKFPILGKRWMANCDIPDLDLLPPRYGLRSIRFYAGLELGFLHLGLWALSWLVRWGLPLDLPKHAALLLRCADLFDGLGSPDGGMFVIINGRGHEGNLHQKSWFIIAEGGDGPQIPTIPAIVLAARAATGALDFCGAGPCVGMVSLEDYLVNLQKFDIKVFDGFAETTMAL